MYVMHVFLKYLFLSQENVYKISALSPDWSKSNSLGSWSVNIFIINVSEY